LPTTKKDLFNFVALCDSLELLKFKEEEIFAIFEIIAALLHLGGVEKTTVATYNPYTYAS
jgi:myosin heavy subunit